MSDYLTRLLQRSGAVAAGEATGEIVRPRQAPRFAPSTEPAAQRWSPGAESFADGALAVAGYAAAAAAPVKLRPPTAARWQDMRAAPALVSQRAPSSPLPAAAPADGALRPREPRAPDGAMPAAPLTPNDEPKPRLSHSATVPAAPTSGAVRPAAFWERQEITPAPAARPILGVAPAARPLAAIEPVGPPSSSKPTQRPSALGPHAVSTAGTLDPAPPAFAWPASVAERRSPFLPHVGTPVALRGQPAETSSRPALPAEPQPPPSPTIRITIGRIDIGAAPAPTSPRQSPGRPVPALSLDSYLAQRNTGGR